MSWYDFVILAIYASLLIELLFFPIKSEVSTFRIAYDYSHKYSLNKRALFIFQNIVSISAWLLPLLLLQFNLALSSNQTLIIVGVIFCVLGRLLTLKGTYQKRVTGSKKLLTTGVFGISRHPIATGMNLTLLGLNFIYINAFEVVLTVVYIISMNQKLSQEESGLKVKFHEYNSYMNRVRRYF